MTTTMVGLLLTGVLVATVAAVLMLMAEISRDHVQGGRVLVGPTYAMGLALPMLAPSPQATRKPPVGYVGRHRRG